MKTAGGWRDEVWSHFMREQIDLFAYLPDGGLDFLIRGCMRTCRTAR